MFPGQILYLIASRGSDVAMVVERTAESIMQLGSTIIERGDLDQRSIVFPIFIAGTATRRPDWKVRALDLIRALEGSGIGQNTTTVRKLLMAVYEEQSAAEVDGRPPGEIYWLNVAEQRGLSVSNCGL